MAEENNFIIDLVAALHAKRSQAQLNSDIKSIQKKLDKLQLRAEIDPKSIENLKKKIETVKVRAELSPDAVQNLVKQLESITNRSITLSNININQGQAEKTGQHIGAAINDGLSSSLNAVRQSIDNVFKDFNNKRLNSYDLSKIFNMNRADIDSSVLKQVRNLTNEINTLSKEVLKSNSDSSWESIVNKINSLYDVLNQFGKSRDLTPFKESLDILKQFEGKKIFVNNKSEVLQNTGMSVRELNNQFRSLNVTFTTSKKNAIDLDTIWSELFNISPNLEKYTTFGDQIHSIVEHLKIAKEALYGTGNLQPLGGREVSNVLLGYLDRLEEASKKLNLLREQETEITQKMKQDSSSATDTVVKNEQRKQEAYRQTIQEMNALNNFKLNTLPKIQDNLSNRFYADQVQQQIEKYNRLGIELPQVRARIDELKTAEQQLNSIMGNENATLEQQRKAYVDFQSALRNANASNSVAGNMYMSQSAIDGLIAKLQLFLQNNTNMTEAAKSEINSWIAKLQQTGGVYKSVGNDAVAAMKRIQTEQAATKKSGDSLFASLKKVFPMFAYWTSASHIMMSAIRSIKKMISNVRELEDALTNINYTMDVSGRQLKEIGESSLQMAKDLNTSASNVLSAVKLYANAKESADSILQKSKPAIMISNVTGMTGEASAKMLQSIMNQFDMTQDDLMEIADTIEMVSQNMAYDFASGIDEIAKGIEQSGSVARAAGLDLQEYVSMLGLVIEKTGQSGSTIGNAYKTIFQRITKASATEGTLEQDISAAEESLRAVGIEVRSTSDEFRDLTDIMSELGKVWGSLSSVQQSNISYNVAGIRQTNILKSLLGYWSEYENLVEKANDAGGTTLQNQEIYAESLTGKLGELSALWEKIGDNAVSSSFLKGLAGVGIGVSSLVEKIGLLKTVIASVGIAAFVKNFACPWNKGTFIKHLLQFYDWANTDKEMIKWFKVQVCALGVLK